jgi:hypothetical protein
VWGGEREKRVNGAGSWIVCVERERERERGWGESEEMVKRKRKMEKRKEVPDTSR